MAEMLTLQITPDFVEWVSQELGMDFEEAGRFAQEFVGMMYFTGCIISIKTGPASATSQTFQLPEGEANAT